MTLSAKKCYDTYAAGVDHRSFDGKPLLEFHEMGEVQQAGWQAVADLGNQHASEAIEPVRKRLWGENLKLARRVSELERQNDTDAYG